MPDGKFAILEYLAKERVVEKNDAGSWNITNLGAILFARELDAFRRLSRKAIRLIQYSGNNRFGNDSNLLIVFYVQIMSDDLVMQLHRF